jgi:septal ring factor EnvC (AmiA/AmiB activator)
MFFELTNETLKAEQPEKISDKNGKSLTDQQTLLAKLHNDCHNINSLTDEIRNIQNTVKELEEKVSEYEMAIELLQHCCSEQESEFTNIVACIDNLYVDKAKKVTHLFIQKHFVRNKNIKGTLHC